MASQSPNLNATENVFLAITLKLHVETDVIKMRVELVNAARGIWRPLSQPTGRISRPFK